MVVALKRAAREAEDWLRYHPTVRRALGACQRWRAGLAAPRSPQEAAQRINRLCAAARLSNDDRLATLQARIRQRAAELDAKAIDWRQYIPGIDERCIAKATVLKPYLGPREKGCIFVSFENEWIKLLRHVDLAAFAARYDLVIAPSASPHNLVNYVFANHYPEPLFTLISNAADLETLPRVSSSLVVVPLYASNWVNPAWFEPKPKTERPYDLIMVANFAKVKRHHVLFQALRDMPADLRVLLIGQDQDERTQASIHEEARWYGVAERFTLLANQPYTAVAQAMCASRASVVLSKREGSCVVVAESLFADAPVALLENAELGSRAFINEQTGVFLKPGDIGRQLTDFVARADQLQPRRWAVANISCLHSSQRLNDVVKEHALAHGGAWTMDLIPLQWCPDPRPVHAADARRLDDERRDIENRFGITIGAKC